MGSPVQAWPARMYKKIKQKYLNKKVRFKCGSYGGLWDNYAGIGKIVEILDENAFIIRDEQTQKLMVIFENEIRKVED